MLDFPHKLHRVAITRPVYGSDELFRIARALRRELRRAYKELLCQGYEVHGPDMKRIRAALNKAKGRL